MSVILFGALPTEQIAVGILALITAALLFNIKKYFARQSPMRKQHIKLGEEAKTAREMAQKNAQIKPGPTFTGNYKPEMIAHWEVEFFELTRQMTAQIDTKMSALSTLSVDAAKICQRMETLLERLERVLQTPTTHPTLSPQSSISAISENFHDFSPIPSPASAFSPQLEPTQEKKTLFPRLSSLSGLEFSDYDDLTALGAELFADIPGTKTYDQGSAKLSFKDWSSPPPVSPPQEFKPQYPNSVELPQDRTLGELLLQEKQNQAAKLQPVSKVAPTLQPTQIESIFKPVEPRPIGFRPFAQVIPRERVGS